MNVLWQDVRYGARTLLKNPGFTFVAVVALALGIGANTAIFSVVDAVLLRPLPFAEPERLVQLWKKDEKRNRHDMPVSVPDFEDWRNQNQSFEQVAAYTSAGFNLTGSGEPEVITGARVSAALFQLVGTKPLLGRAFLPEEDRAVAGRVATISHGFWQRRFGANPDAVGQTLLLDGGSYTVVGVMPPEFRFPGTSEVWTPNAFEPAESKRSSSFLSVIGRLKPGVSLSQAQAEMDSIALGIQQRHPDTNRNRGINLVPLHEQTVGKVRTTLFILLGAVGFVLLIACANVANLLLVRAARRRREIAIRSALGAGRWRLVRQFLTESVLLALMGGAAGVFVAWWGLDLLVAGIPANIPRTQEISLDGRVLMWTLLISLLTGLVFGLVPALQVSKPDLSESLKEGGKSLTGGLRQGRVRNLMIVMEIALSLVLLVGAGLMIKSFWRLQQVETGFNPERVVAVSLNLPNYKYPEDDQQRLFYQATLERIENLPGVSSAGVTTMLPLSGSNSLSTFSIPGRTPPADLPSVNLRAVSPGYFRTMEIPLRRGRMFTERDTAGRATLCLINETLARRYFPDEDPIGKRIAIATDERKIIGVVGDVRHKTLDAEAGPELYSPYLQKPVPYINIIARSNSLDEASLMAAVRGAIRQVDKDQTISKSRTMEMLLSQSVAQPRFNTLLFSLFAAVALTLAAVGIFGVMNYTVTQRTHEIGIRLALGARKTDVMRLVVGQGMALAALGVVVGLVGAFVVTRVTASLLYGVSTTDPIVFAGVALLLTLVAFLACYLPARRATKVDPMIALRYE